MRQRGQKGREHVPGRSGVGAASRHVRGQFVAEQPRRLAGVAGAADVMQQRGVKSSPDLGRRQPARPGQAGRQHTRTRRRAHRKPEPQIGDPRQPHQQVRQPHRHLQQSKAATSAPLITKPGSDRDPVREPGQAPGQPEACAVPAATTQAPVQARTSATTRQPAGACPDRPDPRPPRATPSHPSLQGESAGGVSPPAALRTGRDGLPSSGPHSPALGERDELPAGQQARLVLIHLLQPGHRFGVLAAESPELVHGPPGEMLVDAPCQETQLGAVEGPVIVDPALDLRIDLLSEAGQVLAAAAVEVPVPDLLAFRLLRLAADRRGKAGSTARTAARTSRRSTASARSSSTTRRSATTSTTRCSSPRRTTGSPRWSMSWSPSAAA